MGKRGRKERSSPWGGGVFKGRFLRGTCAGDAWIQLQHLVANYSLKRHGLKAGAPEIWRCDMSLGICCGSTEPLPPSKDPQMAFIKVMVHNIFLVQAWHLVQNGNINP